MKSVMLSIKPKWCELIANGKKTVEVRKTKPKIETPFKCYIYETKGKTEIPAFIDEEGHEIYEGKGQVIGEFVCDLVTGLKANNQIQAYYNGTKETCLSPIEIVLYANGKMIYYWHISDLVIYDKPKELGEFEKCTVKITSRDGFMFETPKKELFALQRPPQSWCYVEEK